MAPINIEGETGGDQDIDKEELTYFCEVNNESCVNLLISFNSEAEYNYTKSYNNYKQYIDPQFTDYSEYGPK